MTAEGRQRLLLLPALLLFTALGFRGAAERGLIAEEVQPYLRRYPVVLEEAGREGVVPMPPDEPGAPARPRLVATSQWPVIGYDATTRLFPIFVRGHQTALGSYVGIAIGPLLGGGMGGVRRSTVLLGGLLIGFAFLLAERLARGTGAACAALVASSLGVLWIARTGYGFEVASRVVALAALVVAAPRRPLSRSRGAAIGLLCGLALLCRATIGALLAPSLALLLLKPERRPSPGSLVRLGVIALGVPLAFYALFAALAPFRDGSAPLADLPFAELPRRLLAVPAQLLLQLAWVGDARSVIEPLVTGRTSLGRPIAAALFAALPLLVAALRWGRGRASEGEQLLVVAVAASAVAGAALYGPSNDFQLALACEPLFALALAAQLSLIPGRALRACLLALTLGARTWLLMSGLALDERTANPMLSARCQRAATTALARLGSDGSDVVSVAYNQVGIVEAWSGEGIRPRHAWWLFRGTSDPDQLDRAWRRVLALRPPRYVLLTDGSNLYEGAGLDPPAITASLLRMAPTLGLTPTPVAAFATESGAPGWSLRRLDPAAR